MSKLIHVHTLTCIRSHACILYGKHVVSLWYAYVLCRGAGHPGFSPLVWVLMRAQVGTE